ncbi:hypothetical protein PG999_009054 [Apiospora kogelbergensis]|uniref:Uncharacterized protein n=1 Tax=Apiospora kogelbergensis TaxID=1337665 RepID=A0AAW0QI97_9PEZI
MDDDNIKEGLDGKSIITSALPRLITEHRLLPHLQSHQSLGSHRTSLSVGGVTSIEHSGLDAGDSDDGSDLVRPSIWDRIGQQQWPCSPPQTRGGRRRRESSSNGRGRRRDVQHLALGMDPQMAHFILDFAQEAKLLGPQKKVSILIATLKIHCGSGVDVVAASSALRSPNEPRGAAAQQRHTARTIASAGAATASHGVRARISRAMVEVLDNGAMTAVALVNVLDSNAHPS